MYQPDFSNLSATLGSRVKNKKVIFGKSTVDTLEATWDRIRVSILDVAEKVTCKLIDKCVLESLLLANTKILQEISGKQSIRRKEGANNVTISSFSIITPVEAIQIIRSSYVQSFAQHVGVQAKDLDPSVLYKSWDIPVENWTVELAQCFGIMLGKAEGKATLEIAIRAREARESKLKEMETAKKNKLLETELQRRREVIAKSKEIVQKSDSVEASPTLHADSFAQPIALQTKIHNEPEQIPLNLSQDMSEVIDDALLDFQLDPEQTKALEVCGTANSGISHMIGYFTSIPSPAKRGRKKKVLESASA